MSPKRRRGSKPLRIISVYVTEREHRELRKAAQDDRLSLSRFILRAALTEIDKDETADA